MKYDAILIQPRAGRLEYLGVRPPDSLLSIAAVPKSKGYKLKILDTRIDNDWKNILLALLRESKPLCVCITCMTGVQIEYALEISRIVKENSNIPVIWGGVHPTFLPEQTLENKYIDAVIFGEGDYSFYELLDTLKNKKSLDLVNGLCYKKNGVIIKNAPRPLIQNLDELPSLPYDLIDLNSYYGMNVISGEKSITMTTSRGCPFKCTFCYNTNFYRNSWRAMSAAKVVKNIKSLVLKYGIKQIYFHDDNFSVDMKRVDAIVNGLIDEDLNVTWGLLGTRIDTLDRMSDDFLKRLKKSGCVNIDIGIESGSPRILKMIKKSITIKKIISVNKKLAKHGFISKYTFIVGFPTETKKDLSQSVNLALRLVKDNSHAYTPFFIFSLYPGTEIFDLALKHGYKQPKKLEDWIDCNYETSYLRYPWLSKRMIKTIRNLEFTSNFANKNIKYKINKPFLRFLFDIYNPIAKFRFKNNFYYFPLERFVVQLFK